MRKDIERLSISISTGTIVRVILAGFLVMALAKLWSLLLILLTSIVIASFVEGGVKRMKGYNVGRILAVVLIYVAIVGVIAGIVYLFIPLLLSELKNIIDIISKYLPANANIIDTSSLKDANTVFKSLAQSDSLVQATSSLKTVLAKTSGGVFDFMSSLFGGIINFVLIFVISFYLSIQEKGIQKFLRIVTPDKHEAYVIDLWERSQRKIGLWIRGQMLLGVVIAVIIYIGLMIMGLPSALVLALIAGFSELIPFGIILATVPAVSFAYVDGGISLALMVTGFYIIVQQLETYVIQPIVVKRVIGVSPLVVILSILAGAKLAGFWGLILAVPVAVALLEYMDDIERRKIELAE